MKLKFIILVSAALIALPSFSQKKKNSKAESEASRIIEFSNSVIKMGNSNNEIFGTYQQLLQTADNNAERLSKNPNLQPFYVNCKGIPARAEQAAAYKTALKSVQNFPEKADIEKYVETGNNHMNSLSQWCASISSYFADKQYQSDTDFAKYSSMRDSLIYYLDLSSANWRSASAQASAAGNRAELLLLEGSKIASFVIPMKTDLNSLDKIFGMFDSQQLDIQAVRSELEQLTASIEKNKDTSTKDLSKLKDIYYKEVYQTFYRKCGEAAKALQSLTERIEDASDADLLNRWFGSANSHYSEAVQKYNLFISQ